MRLTLIVLVTACAHATPNPEAVLRAQTQALLDGVTAGDKTPWQRYVDPRITYISEAGETETKQSLLDQVEPLPPGITGHLAIASFHVEQFGDTAIVVHVDDESETYFGHELAARYITTATWRLVRGTWTMIGSQVYAALQDPPAIALANLDEYAGTYRLNADITYAIRRDGDHLAGERTGRPAVALAAEARDVFFIAGQPRSRKVFLRDASGKLTGFADRREGRDVVWTRE